ncbi:hypothetical protein CANCADRAFT_32605 [Tortispora caseinolytica NRRL Y-17796]|uniref:Xanthine dehydrogenase n=1 Tax=Tortispora caseinolytica NRRL Y-17796 TaxID=767744 RepID=A0A1E4TC13_9ASCO|nr:hypothetical protein CANCADRAFT_32605 [Tortispora caseinolytica NRRL Y-17796]
MTPSIASLVPESSIVSTVSQDIAKGELPPLPKEIDASSYTTVLTFYLNGVKQVVRNPNPEGTLLDYLRLNAHLTGTKLGCSEGGCGACTIVVASIDPDTNSVYYAAINSCIAPLIFVEGKHLITVEGIGNVKNPHPAQERIAYFHGSQCGFCTPGIVMSLYALLRNTDGSPSKDQIVEAWDGNLCRCTGYKPIIDAANTFVSGCARGKDCCKNKSNGQGCGGGPNGTTTNSDGNGMEVDMNKLMSPNGMPLKPAYTADQELIFPPSLRKYELPPIYFGNFRKVWFRPTSKAQLLQIKSAYPSAKIVGGSSEIQIEIKMKAANYNVSVFANDIPELKAFSYVPGQGLHFGSNISLSRLEEVLHALIEGSDKFSLPKLEPHQTGFFRAMLHQLKYFAGRQIRNAATPAGNIATASPISDLNPVLVSAHAVLTVEQEGKEPMELSMADFFISYRNTKLPTEGIITSIFVPETTKLQHVAAYKQAKRKDDDIAIVTSSFFMEVDDNNVITQARLVYGGMAPITLAAKDASSFLVGKNLLDRETLESTFSCLERDFNLPYGVPGGMATYRRGLALSFFYRFYNQVKSDLNLEFDADVLTEVTRDHVKGKRDIVNPFESRILGKSNPHLSALKQVTGEAVYVDDIPPQHGELFGVQVLSTKARAKILSVDFSAALEVPGVVDYVDINDLPNREANMWGSVNGYEPFFADGEVFYAGQCIGVVLAETELAANEGMRAVKVEYEDLPFITTIEEAIEANSYFDHIKPQTYKGDIEEGLKKAKYVFEGTNRMGAQEHFYLETQGALAVPEPEDGELKIYSSSQNPTETQHFVASATGVPDSRIVCRVKRLGGGFGGKESRCVQLAGLASIGAVKTKRPVRMILSRAEDMQTSGQRHPFLFKWRCGFDENYKMTAYEVDLYCNAGWTMDLSKGVIERAVLHADNVYFCPNVTVRGWICKTNTASNTAFRGFGGPQGMFACESMFYEVADRMNIDLDELRRINYYDKTQNQSTSFKQAITEDFSIPEIVEQLHVESDYEARKAQVSAFNKEHKWIKRGITTTPTKFGISFGALFLNQAGALVHIYHDGSILLTHGGTEMGQGLHTKMAMICAHELQVPLDNVFISETATNTVPNTSPSAASASSDLNGGAVKNACDQLNERLRPYREKFGPNATMREMAHAAYMDRVNLSANGFYKTPDIGFIFGEENPKPAFYYFTQGACVSEVEVNMLTGDFSVIRTDIKMDIGRPINQAIDYGQIEGAYVQGQGLFTTEQSLWFAHNGQIFTRGPGAYKIPGFRDIPQEFNVTMLKDRPFNHLNTIHRSKGIGEPPLFLGSTVLFAIREAVKAGRKQFGLDDVLVLNSPCTAERIRLAVGDDIIKRAVVTPKKGEKPFLVEA